MTSRNGLLEYLKGLAVRVLGRGPLPLRPPPEAPDAGVREPRRRAPGGRGSSVALEEPRDADEREGR